MALSEAQTSLHWNNQYGWGRVCSVNGWWMENGRLSAEANGKDHSQWHAQVWAFATMLADQQNKAVAPDHLRKGTYLFALGKLKSLTQFDNEDLDRCLNAFALLIGPDNLDAVKDRLAYEEFDRVMAEIARCKRLDIECDLKVPDHPGERRRHLAFVRRNGAPRSLLVERFNGRDPEDMPLWQLRQLTATLKNRRPYGRKSELAGIECPF